MRNAGLWIVVLAGCTGGPRGETTDGGSDGLAPGPGIHAFVVESTYRPTSPDAGAGAGATSGSHRFTLVLDLTAEVAIAGRDSVPLARIDDRTFRIEGDLTVALTTSDCGASISYRELTVTFGAGTITASGTGLSNVVVGDIGTGTPIEMSLTGRPDTEPPSLLFSGGSSFDPFAVLDLRLSEMVPPGATAALRASNGDSIPLVAQGTADSRGVYGFRTPEVVVRPGESYDLTVSNLVDFAGNVGGQSTVPLVTRAAPPLVSEDGFESAEGAIGEATAVSGPGWPILAGTRSLYLPAVPGWWPAPPVSLRIGLSPDDGVLRFSYRTVRVDTSPVAWPPSFRVGAPGSRAGWNRLPHEPGPFEPFQLPDGSTVFLGEPKVAEIAIPVGSTGDLMIERVGSSGLGCGLPGSPETALIIDDLRAEPR